METNEAIGVGLELPPEPEGLDIDLFELGVFPIDSLMIRTEVRSVFEIARRIDSGQYVMDPDFQRDFVWDLDRQSKLIESAILRIPLPVLYLAETRDGKNVVVDGLQRLTTFHRFLNGQFALTGLAFARDLTGYRFSDLPTGLKNRIEDTQLTIYLIDAKVPEDAKYEIFERVNSGVPLTRQQMRNCLFVGEATRWLSQMAKDEQFLLATEGGLNWKTMRDRECINRFAGFYLYGYDSYTGRMDAFLAETLGRMNSEMKESQDYDDLSAHFRNSMSANHLLFGRHAFRKTLADPPNTWGRSVINVALFDVFSVLLADIPVESLEDKKLSIQMAAGDLLKDAAFQEAISRSTNSTRNVRIRFGLAKEMIETILS
jgi:hypothetical protein